MVNIYLSRLPSLTRSLKCVIAEIEKEIKLYGWQKNYDELLVAVAGHDESINPCIFAQRQLSKESLSQINWEKFTGCFMKKTILETVKYYARNKDDWQMMTDAIKAAAIQYDYDYGFEDYEEEGWDEDGPYTRTIKVEKEPYDSDGNYCLEPLKRKGVYDFCDELKNRFEELSFKGQLSLIGQPTKGAHRSRQESQGQPNLFRENLDVGAIIEELKALVPPLLVGKNRERVIMKYVYSVFAELKWLRDTMQTHFISWAKANRIVSFASKDFKNINVDRSDSTYDAILNSFSERQTSGKYKDKEMFYLKNAQGYTKRIYNNG